MKAKHLLNLVGDRLHTLPLLVLYLTDGCNSRCVTCDIWRSPRRDMSPELVDELVASCKPLNVRWVLLSGGEAMQHPEWPTIARRLRAEGAYVMLLTNGLLLRKQAAETAASVDEVIVSLDGGTPETYRAIRGVDGYNLILEGIQAVRALGLPVSTRTTVQRANFHELSQIVEAAQTAGVNRVSFLTVDVSSATAFGPRFSVDPSLTLTPAGQDPRITALTTDDVTAFARVLDEMETRFSAQFASGLISESPDKLRRMLDYFSALNGEGAFPRPRCNAPHISVVVEVDGTLRPCYFLPDIGKLNGLSLREVLNSPAAQALRQAYRTGQRPECERCVCPLYKGPRALLRM